MSNITFCLIKTCALISKNLFCSVELVTSSPPVNAQFQSNMCIMNTSLHFLLLLCQSCFSLRNVSFGSGILGLTKSGYHGWLSMMTSSEGPPFQVLPRAPPILNPSLFLAFVFSLLSCFHSPRIVSFFPFSSFQFQNEQNQPASLVLFNQNYLQ